MKPKKKEELLKQLSLQVLVSVQTQVSQTLEVPKVFTVNIMKMT
jgi:hypothetical protein